jgi:hypothetical protein
VDSKKVFVWKDHSRYVEVLPVTTGWFVVWGRYEDGGRRKLIAGNQVYTSRSGARRRVADAVLDLTRRPNLAAEAVFAFDGFAFPAHEAAELPAPL